MKITGQSKRGRPPGTTRQPSTPDAQRRAAGKGKPKGRPSVMTAGARVPESGPHVNITVRISHRALAAIAANTAAVRADFVRDAIYAKLDAEYPQWNQAVIE